MGSFNCLKCFVVIFYFVFPKTMVANVSNGLNIFLGKQVTCSEDEWKTEQKNKDMSRVVDGDITSCYKFSKNEAIRLTFEMQEEVSVSHVNISFQNNMNALNVLVKFPKISTSKVCFLEFQGNISDNKMKRFNCSDALETKLTDKIQLIFNYSALQHLKLCEIEVISLSGKNSTIKEEFLIETFIKNNVPCLENFIDDNFDSKSILILNKSKSISISLMKSHDIQTFIIKMSPYNEEYLSIDELNLSVEIEIGMYPDFHFCQKLEYNKDNWEWIFRAIKFNCVINPSAGDTIRLNFSRKSYENELSLILWEFQAFIRSDDSQFSNANIAIILLSVFLGVFITVFAILLVKFLRLMQSANDTEWCQKRRRCENIANQNLHSVNSVDTNEFQEMSNEIYSASIESSV